MARRPAMTKVSGQRVANCWRHRTHCHVVTNANLASTQAVARKALIRLQQVRRGKRGSRLYFICISPRNTCLNVTYSACHIILVI